MRVVTVASDVRPALDALNRSLAALAAGDGAFAPLAVLGLGQPWRGLGSKITLVEAFLDAECANDDLVMLVDAFDVLLTPAAAELRARFAALAGGRALAFGAERKCSPDKAARDAYPPGTHGAAPFPYLNSGQYMGAAFELRPMLVEIRRDLALHYSLHGADALEADDQRYFTRYYLAHVDRVALDVHGVLFHTLLDVEPADLRVLVDADGGGAADDGGGARPGAVTLWSDASRTAPCMVHGNGYGRPAFYDVSERLASAGWPPAAEDIVAE